MKHFLFVMLAGALLAGLVFSLSCGDDAAGSTPDADNPPIEETFDCDRYCDDVVECGITLFANTDHCREFCADADKFFSSQRYLCYAEHMPGDCYAFAECTDASID